MLSRREFLRKSALVTAGVIAAHQLELLDRLAPRSLFASPLYIPHLWGDGIHDDTEALQALIDGQRAYDRVGRQIKVNCYLRGGVYRITKTLEVGRAEVLTEKRLNMANCQITGTLMRDTPFIRFPEAPWNAVVRFENLFINA